MVPTPGNRLAREKSPYLLQHAHNPVDWYPWGDEAFARARAEDKPVFLSIGYSTCHWCHVMERESFEDPAVAALLNAHFVAVKVDREERPDVDRLYMTAMQAMGQGGGWPLNVFLTPDLAPFWGGTYFPPTTRHGRPGMVELLPRVAAAWREHRDQVAESGDQVLRAVAALATPDRAAEDTPALARQCEEWLARAHDPAHGGFGTAPKFPSPGNLSFLFRRFAADATRTEARDMALAQLDAMIAGGIHDQLGGGFHRYSTDREWMVPHFEKMLYDQALIADNLLDAVELTRAPRHADALRALLGYVARELTAPGGAFWSAEDADAEGHEGRFHVWTPAQVAAALGDDDARLVALAYGVTAQGNFEDGATVLHRARTSAQVAAAAGLSEPVVTARLAAAEERLLAVRARRVRPHLDDKVLTAWNALMIAAMARAGRVLDEPGWTARAERAMGFLWTQSRDAGGGLHRRWRKGEAAGAGQLDDHAYTAHALLELHATTLEPHWLAQAVAVTEVMLARFWDETDGACFENPADDPTVRVRMKDGFDGAELAGNSLACEVLVRLAALTGRDDLHDRTARTTAYFARRLAGHPWAMPRLLVAMERATRPPRHVVVVGERDGADTRTLLAVQRARFRPFEDLLLVDPASRDALAALAPFTASLTPIAGQATAFVCIDRACRLPVTDPAAFAAQLDT